MTVVLIDSNILVYSCDLAEPAKKERAREIMEHLQTYQQGCLSVQCVSEFLSVVSRGKLPKMTVEVASLQVDFFLRSFIVYPITPVIVREAVRAVKDYRVSYFDAQIWACAKLHEVPLVFSEDFQDGQVLEGVRFVNPFAATFKLENWT